MPRVKAGRDFLAGQSSSGNMTVMVGCGLSTSSAPQVATSLHVRTVEISPRAVHDNEITHFKERTRPGELWHWFKSNHVLFVPTFVAVLDVHVATGVPIASIKR